MNMAEIYCGLFAIAFMGVSALLAVLGHDVGDHAMSAHRQGLWRLAHLLEKRSLVCYGLAIALAAGAFVLAIIAGRM
jgi:hypothetical protein